MFKYPVYKPLLNGREREYTIDCLESSWISSKGKYVDRFEREFANYIGTKHAVSVCNGTAALHTSLLALGIGPGDEVIVPTLTYIASVNAITYTGATPVFAESLKNTWQIDPVDVAARITSNTKAIMAVHLYGYPCHMGELGKLAKKFNLILIEDCAEAIGSEFLDRKVGSIGDISCFSFFGNKTITTGEGGMVNTNIDELDAKVRRIKGQGLADNREYWHDLIGYNYRMTNIEAAIGCAQLEKVDHIVERKIAIANLYRNKLEGLPVTFHNFCDYGRHTYWMCSILTENAKSRDSLRHHLENAGIETRPLFNPVHTMPIYPGRKGDFPIAENLSDCGINLPSYPELTNYEIDFIAGSVNEYFNGKLLR
jgi:perosamine synthetase